LLLLLLLHGMMVARGGRRSIWGGCLGCFKTFFKMFKKSHAKQSLQIWFILVHNLRQNSIYQLTKKKIYDTTQSMISAFLNQLHST
jgi:hypothetical protein